MVAREQGRSDKSAPGGSTRDKQQNKPDPGGEANRPGANESEEDEDSDEDLDEWESDTETV